MTELQIRAILAGLFFGMWPLLMNRSGFNNANVSTTVLEGIIFLIVLPFGLRSLDIASLGQVNWTFTLLACVTAALGILAFNGGLAMSTPETVSTFFVFMITVQILVPAVYQVVLTGLVTPFKLLGFATAALTMYFLSK